MKIAPVTSSSNGSQRKARSSGLFDVRLVEKSGIWDARELVMSGRCPICNNKECVDVIRRSDGLVIKECRDCGLAFIDPRPDQAQLSRYYSEGYFQGEKDFFRGKDYCLERDRSIRDETVTGYEEIALNFELEGKSVLDVGCASGALLYLLRQKRTRNVIGIDSAEYPVSFGVDRYGLDLRCTALEEAGLPDAHFDLITVIDVIEHVVDLSSFLLQLQRVIKPGGHLFIITPNYSAYALARNKWTCLFKDYEHLQYFSEDSLQEVCRRLGWSLVKSWSDSVPFRVYEYPRLYESGVHRLLHPNIAIKNRLSQKRYDDAALKSLFMGASLNVILQAPGQANTI